MKLSRLLRWTSKGLVVTLLAMSLASCSALFGRHGYFRDRGDDYVKAREIPPMKVPASLDAGSAISELYVIPPVSNEYVDTEREFEVPKPDFKSMADRSQVRIQKLDEQRWIVMNVDASEVWPRIQQFLLENRIGMASSNPSTGKIETTWLKPKDVSASLDRYRISVEPGIRPGTSEIHVLQAGTATVPTTDPGWPAQSADREKEKWFLDLLAAYLTQEDKAGASLLAQSVGGAGKVEFVEPFQAEPYLLFTISRARSWGSVGGALRQVPFVITDADQEKGYYTITYDPTPPDTGKKPGFFCRLTGCVERAQEKREKNLQHYRVQFSDVDAGGVKVFVKDPAGNDVPVPDAEKILSLIKQQLV